jgi:bifunctional diaminopimelate decarboxylase / aspartate kinase
MMSEQIHDGLGAVAVETPFADSPFVVMKFGGRSVATAENWQKIAELLRRRLDEGFTPVVVHSALAGVSNALEALLLNAVNGNIEDEIAAIEQRHFDLASALGVKDNVFGAEFQSLRQLIDGVCLVGEVSPRIHARVMATGELLATALGAAYLQTQNLPVHWRDARELLQSETQPDQTERSRILSANCSYQPQGNLQAELSALDGFIITQGFIARSIAGDTVLLGRGGSDTSGAYLAALLQARRLEIWTDVPGFFSSDPKAVPSARLLRRLHYREAQEIASAGGGILHPRSISPVRKLGIPLFLRCTAHPEWEGTLISSAEDDDTPQLKAISQRCGLTLISMESMEMWHQVGFLADAFQIFRRHGLSVDLISTSESNVTVSIDTDANVADRSAVTALAEDLGALCRVSIIEDCAAVTLVGRRIRAILHELSSIMEVFEEQKVHLVTQAANDLNFTFVVNSEHAHRLVQRLHALLVNKFQEGGIFGPTWEQLVKPTPVSEPIVRSVPWWEKKRSELLTIADHQDAAFVYDRDTIRTALNAMQSLSSVDAIFYAMKANAHPEILKTVNEQQVNFECVSPGEIQRVLETLPEIDRRRILFTPNFAPRQEYEWALENGVWVTLDNLHPLRHWPELFAGQEIFVRIDTGQGRGHHEHVRTAGVHSKFGVPLFELDEFSELVAAADAQIVGLHAHTGSGVLNTDNWRETGDQLNALRDQFPAVRYMDLGGGIGIPERPGENPIDIPGLDSAIAKVKDIVGSTELWLEPGRFIVAQAGVLIARVTQTKGKEGMQYVGVNTGMNSLIRPALYGAYHEIVNLSRLEATPSEVVTIVGPVCETGDRLGSDRLLPVTEEGDVLLIANAGAYGRAMSSHYNLRDPAPEILV